MAFLIGLFRKALINQWSKSQVGWVGRVGFFVCGLKCLKRLAKLQPDPINQWIKNNFVYFFIWILMILSKKEIYTSFWEISPEIFYFWKQAFCDIRSVWPKKEVNKHFCRRKFVETSLFPIADYFFCPAWKARDKKDQLAIWPY